MAKRKVKEKVKVEIEDRTQTPTLEGQSRLDSVSLANFVSHRAFQTYDPLPQDIRTSNDVQVVVDEGVTLFVQVSLGIRGYYDDTPDDAELPEIPLVVMATVELRYTIENLQELTPEQLAAFAKRAGLVHAWPYWREYVCSATTRLGLPAMMVPLLKYASRRDVAAVDVPE